jgi:hypothetical protein
MKKRILQLSAVAALVAVSVSGVANTVNVGVTIGDTLTTSNPTTASFGTVTVGTGTLIIRLPRSGPLTRVSAPSTGTVTTGQAGAITITGTGTGNVTITWPSGSIATGVAVDLADGSIGNLSSCALTTTCANMTFGGILTIDTSTAAKMVYSASPALSLIYS